jgi:PAS domain S-box-containing protein
VESPTPSSPSIPVPHEARILIVDDHLPNLVALDAILEPLHRRVIRATSGEDALKELLHGDFACILLDVQMPGLDGFQTAALIRAHPRTKAIPILFLTAYSKEPAHVFRGYRTGAVDYMVKPFDPDVLRSKVSVFVDLWVAREQVRVAGEILLQKERDAHERQSATRSQHLLDTMPLAAWAARADGQVVLVNRFLSEYAGRQLEAESIGLSSIVHDDDRKALDAAWEKARTEGAPLEIEYRLRCGRDGSHRWFLGRIVPEREDGGAIIGWIGTATDIEDHKRDQAALLRANAAKDEFISAASHELRTPLAAAKAQAQLARRRLGDGGDPKALQALEVIGRQIDRITRLVEDLLDLSRLQNGRISLELRSFDVAASLREVAERVQALTDKHPIEVVTREMPEIVGDRDRIEQVFTNLLTNAVRYSPEGGPIHVEARVNEDGVDVSVRDHGLGVPAEQRDRIFERFSRAHGTRYGGLGLGLAITLGIVQQHGGRIWVESKGVPGDGSTFHVHLPKDPPRAVTGRRSPVPFETLPDAG